MATGKNTKKPRIVKGGPLSEDIIRIEKKLQERRNSFYHGSTSFAQEPPTTETDIKDLLKEYNDDHNKKHNMTFGIMVGIIIIFFLALLGFMIDIFWYKDNKVQNIQQQINNINVSNKEIEMKNERLRTEIQYLQNDIEKLK